MRRMTPILVCAALWFAAHPAIASPTCQDRNGDTTRCGTSEAMPVGWTLPTGEMLARQASKPPEPMLDDVLAPICIIIGFLAFLALLPEFDGWSPGDWDKQEGDDDDRL